MEGLTGGGNDGMKELVMGMWTGCWHKGKRLPSVPLAGHTGAFQAAPKSNRGPWRALSMPASSGWLHAERNLWLQQNGSRKPEKRRLHGKFWNVSEKILITSERVNTPWGAWWPLQNYAQWWRVWSTSPWHPYRPNLVINEFPWPVQWLLLMNIHFFLKESLPSPPLPIFLKLTQVTHLCYQHGNGRHWNL